MAASDTSSYAFATDADAAMRAVRTSWEQDGRCIVVIAGPADAAQDVAQQVGRALDLNLHAADLKNLLGDRLAQTRGALREHFDAAQEQAALLVFTHVDLLMDDPDEQAERDSDALTAVDYLFQRAESFEGVVALCIEETDHVRWARAYPVDVVLTA